MHWMILPLKRYFDFSGRSQRMEFWIFLLGYIILSIVFSVIMFAGIPWTELFESIDNPEVTPEPDIGAAFIVGLVLLSLLWLGTLVPSIAVVVRRFHDQNMSGWFFLLYFVPYVGFLIIFVFMCIEGTRGPNRFGNDPKDPGSTKVFE